MKRRSNVRVVTPELVLADVMMPGLDGFELLRRMRSDGELRTIAFVLVTARAGESSAVEGLEAGANDYIAKPFTARELVVRVGAQLEISRLRRRTAERDAFLLAVSDALRPLTDPLEIMTAAALVLAEHLRVDRVAYGEVTGDGSALVIEREYPREGKVSLVGTYRFVDFPMPVGDLAGGVTFVSEDVAHDKRFSAEGKAVFAAIGSARFLGASTLDG